MSPCFATVNPLPRTLAQPRLNGDVRRHRIGDHDLDPGVLRHFNDLLLQLDLQRPELERDQLASAARELVDPASSSRTPACIQQRMLRGCAIDRMAADRDWTMPLAMVSFAVDLVVRYLRSASELIPNTVPVVGRLDDVIVIDTAWPKVAAEVHDYLDFCRLRRIEARLRGMSDRHFGFTRDDWQTAARAEAEWVEHCRRVGSSSYLGSVAVIGFRVH